MKKVERIEDDERPLDTEPPVSRVSSEEAAVRGR